ncbi:hypothetical protein JST97_17670 [bacterium]|nr:hypothetical protein [bacterium]
MICLECGHDGGYAVEHCAGCGRLLRVARPHAHPNHVSQIQVAIDEYLEGQLRREALLPILQRFEDRVSEFETRWGGLMETLFKDRLAEGLRQHYQAATIEIDRAMVHLVEALSLLQEFQQEGPDELLAQAQQELLLFFRLACGGCALVMHELELEQGRAVKLGNAADFSV